MALSDWKKGRLRKKRSRAKAGHLNETETLKGETGQGFAKGMNEGILQVRQSASQASISEGEAQSGKQRRQKKKKE